MALPAAPSEGPLPRRRIRAVVTDVDGTLFSAWGSEQPVSAGNGRALARAMEQGISVCLATGRIPGPWSDAVRGQLPGLGPGVFANGALVLGAGGEVLAESCLPQAAEEVVRQYTLGGRAGGGGQLMLLAATRWEAAGPSYGSLRYVELAPQGPTWATDLIKSAGEPDVVLLPDLGGICSGRVLKFVLFTKPGEPGWASMPEVVRVLRLQLEAAGATVVDCGPRHCEVLPPGVHKGVGMLRLLEHLGVGADETLACGDGPNDVEMLQMAGVGAAVGNAGPEARAAADAVVASAEADGVADAVVRFALRQPAGAAQG